MSGKTFLSRWTIAGCGAILCAGALSMLFGQKADNFFTQVDANNDGIITREEFKGAIAKWMAGDRANTASLTQDQLSKILDSEFPESAFAILFVATGPQPTTPKQSDVEKMMAALPDKAPAAPRKPRKVLVLSKAAGFVHSCIPLAGLTVDELGKKTGAWTTTISYDPAVITAENLKQYDLLFLNNTTGEFLDDPSNPAATAARKKALLDFVRSGKGLAGIHAAADSYHRAEQSSMAFGGYLAPGFLNAADKNGDKKVTADELSTLADTWWGRMDTAKSGKLSQQEFRGRFRGVLMNPSGTRRPATFTAPARGRQGRDTQIGTWPAFNTLIGAYFKWHWLDPQHIVYKIDDPDSPLTAMFKGIDFSVNDETYTFSIRSWSRKNLHVLTSIDYSKMSEEDKLKEDYPREDHDYGLSWIRREGKGRVFYEAHGHSERVYAIKPMLEHLLAGIQYAMGDLKANDSPSAK